MEQLRQKLFTMFKLLEERLSFVLRNVALPQAISKYVIDKPILGSHAFTIVVWLSVFFWCRIFFYLFLYPAYFSKFRHLPTPKERSWLWGNFPPHFAEPMGMTLRTINEQVPNNGLIRVYGFLCQERILVTSTKALGELLVPKGYEFTKTFQLKYNASRMIGVGLACSEGEQHRQQRKHLLPAFSIRHIKGLYPSFWTKTAELVTCVDREANGDVDRVVQMKGWCSKVTLDIMGVTGMDHDFHSLTDADSPLIRSYSRLFAPPPKQFRYFAQIGNFVSPRIIARLPLKFNKMIKQHTECIHRETAKIIADKRRRIAEGKDTQLDIIGQALRSDGAFTDDNLVDQMMNFLAAGHETTSTSLQWLILAMCRHQHMQDRLRQEIRSGLPATSFPLDAAAMATEMTPPTADMIDKLAYTKAVCNEVLRCHPPAPQNIRVSDYADSYIDGEFIPKGTKLLVAPQSTNHDPNLWGAEAAEFNPDRWMAPGQSNAGGASSAYAHMTFLHGPHGCIGKDFAKAELNVLTACLFGSFKFRLANPNVGTEYAQGITVTPAGGVSVHLEVVVA